MSTEVPFSADSSKAAEVKKILEDSDSLLGDLEQGRVKKWQTGTAAITYLHERLVVLDMLEKVKQRPDSIVQEAHKRGQSFLDELDHPSAEVMEGLRWLLPKGWRLLPPYERKRREEAEPVAQEELMPPKPATEAERLWVEMERFKKFSSHPSRELHKALVYTLEGEGLTREELLSQAFGSEKVAENKKMFGPLMRGAHLAFGHFNHRIDQVNMAREIVSMQGQKEIIFEPGFKVVPETSQVDQQEGEKREDTEF